jgi:hypothetical protein
MNVLRVSRLLLMAVPVLVPAWGMAQPAAEPAEPPPPHVLRIAGDGAQVLREGAPEVLAAGDPVLYGDRLDAGNAYVQVQWADGSRVSVDRGGRLEALATDLLAVTAGRVVVIRPAGVEGQIRVDTPAASVVLAHAGEYRFTLDGDTTTVGVVRGRADVQNGMGERVVESGQQVALRDGLAPEAARRYNAAGYDSFFQWATLAPEAPSAGTPLETFADPRFEAYSDVFNRHGSWETDPQAGAVWYPTVGADWRPYADGYWQEYGASSQWLWVARDPWGWPTHHYGHWGMNPRGRWYWAPGRQWSPGHVSWSVGPGYIGWTPLGRSNQPLWAWDDFTNRPGRSAYPGGTLDPGRAWTVIPSDRFGRRDRLGAYSVDPRTLDNLSAFVTQRQGPPPRYGAPRGGVYGYGPGSGSVYGPGGYYGGRRTGGDTSREIRRGGPTRVGPPAPGYGGPTPPAEDPYERAQRAVAPRGRQRAPQDGDANTPPPPAAETPAPRQRNPGRAPATAPRETPPPPPAAESAPPAESAPAAPTRSGGTTSRATGESTGRRAVPRP